MTAESLRSNLLTRWVIVAALALAWCLVAPVSASAQSYKADEVDTSLRRAGQIVKRYIRDPGGNADDAQTYRDYFAKYYFPAMTQPTDRYLQDLGKMRFDLFRQFIGSARPNEQTELSDQALEFAKGVVSSGRYHPAVTYNALLILGQIDTRYGADPTPSADANALLCAVAARAAADARLPRLMLSGALVGLERHAKHLSNLPQANQTKTLETLTAVLDNDNLPGEYREGVRGWVYCQAARALANAPGEDQGGARLAAITKRMADESLDLETRLDLAATLGDLEVPQGAAGGAEAAKVAHQLAVETAAREHKAATAFEDLFLSGRGRAEGGLPSRGDDARRMKVSANGALSIERTGLLASLNKLDTALESVKPLADEALQAKIDRVLAALSDVQRAAADSTVRDLNFAATVKRMADQVDATAAEEVAAGADEAVEF